MTRHFADCLLDAIEKKGVAACVGLDPLPERLPPEIRRKHDIAPDAPPDAVCRAIEEYGTAILETVAPLVPAVKINIAFFERYYDHGIRAYLRLTASARRLGLIVIGDVKRADIGHSTTQYARAQLADVDRKATELMCERAREMPLAIFNFVEGTRFTPAKRDAQNSPFRHLLRPKAGGVAQVLSHLGEQLDGILDVTLHYENPQPTFWGFLCGREGRITLDARRLDVPEWMLDSRYHDDPHYKERFHTWLNALWQEKDQALDSR